MADFIVPEINGIVQSLHQISEEKFIKFMLITQGISPTTDFSFHFSNHFTKSETTDIRIILERSITNIRPVLNHFKTIKLYKSFNPSINNDEVACQLRDLFNSLNQNVCKDIAKSWIKILQPDKQKYFPYTRKDIKPEWWPPNVVHTEPDHLKKDERIQVLINVVRDPKFQLENVNVNSIRHKIQHTEAIIHEILYICHFERIISENGLDTERLQETASMLEKGLLKTRNVVDLIVSDMRYHDPEGILQSRIDEKDTNNRIFKIGAIVPTSHPKELTLTRQLQPPNLKKVRKQRTIKRTISIPAMSRLETDLRVASSSTVVQPTDTNPHDYDANLTLRDSGDGSHSSLGTPVEHNDHVDHVAHAEHTDFTSMFNEPPEPLGMYLQPSYQPNPIDPIDLMGNQHGYYGDDENQREPKDEDDDFQQ
ncbi:hypothetical protein K6H09_000621 [Candida tropicalis]